MHGINNKLPAKSCVMVKITEIYNAMWGPADGKTDRLSRINKIPCR